MRTQIASAFKYLRARNVSGKLVATAGVITVMIAASLMFGWRTYNELVDMEHFLEVAHGKMLVEMQRKRDILVNSRKAVAMYAAMEEQIQHRLIELHRLTKTHGSAASAVKSEGVEILNLVRELDLLVEKYPALESKGPYVMLMETIQETGFKVISERLNFNNWTYNYNITCRLFPHSIVARLTGFGERPFIQGPLDYAMIKDN